MGKWQNKHSAIMSVYLVLRRGREVLLLLRENTGYRDGEYGLPAGHVDGNESLHDAVIREAQEEIGINVLKSDLELIHVMHRHCGDHERVDFFFSTAQWEGKPRNAEPNKCGEVAWFNINDLPENIIEYYAHMFNEVEKGGLISYYGWEKLIT
jgi:ADP-ribose pyrophosphatase YjhB (NUDIX family)